jgi:signal transduction histidine kinase
MATNRFDLPHVEAFEPQFVPRGLHDERVRAILWLTLIYWVVNFALMTLATELGGRGHLLQLIPIRIGEMALGLGFCFAIHLLLRKLRSTKKRLIVLALVAPVAAETFAWACFFAESTIYADLNLENFTWGAAVRTILQWTWFFLGWAGVYLAVSYSFDVREEQQRTAELRERAHAAQLRALHSQINPHFLFNSLNSVSALILDKQIDRADSMVAKLAQFLRLGLSADPMHKIPLSTEVRLQRTYLEIEQLRYPDLQISIDVADELLDARVPALILQPIIENAVKYGVTNHSPPAAIRLRAWQEGAEVHLEVINNSNGANPVRGGAGIGLSNVRQRLRLIYGEDSAGLVAERLHGGTYRVEMRFPLELQ